MPATKIYDAIVIGSGITGGWAAKELTEKGLNVLLLEAGRPIVPEHDYVEHVPSWELKYRGWDYRDERSTHTAKFSVSVITPAMNTPANFSSTISTIPTPPIPTSPLLGFVAARLAASPSCGAVKAIV